MFGYVEWTNRRRVVVHERVISKLCFLSVSIPRHGPAALQRYCIRAAARRLERFGITRAVFPEGFEALEIFARCGIQPIDPLPLYRALAAELVWNMMAKAGLNERTALVAVCGDRLTAEIQRTVTALCVRCRYVLLCAPQKDSERFCRKLRREMGVPLVLTEEVARIDRADVLVQFAPIEGLEENNPVRINLFQGAKQTLPSLQAESVLPPEGCDASMFYTVLWETGMIRAGQITLAEDTVCSA